MTSARAARGSRAVLVALLLGCVAACSAGHAASTSSEPAPSSSAPSHSSASPAPSAPSTSHTSSVSSAAASSTSVTNTAAAKRAAHEIADIADDLGHGGVSVAVRDITTGATFTTGATRGMYEGSIAKLDIAETLMLQHQRSRTALSATERDLVEDMIEHSDNHAADTLWTREGGRTAVAKANATLGLHHTTLGPGILWGFSTTGAGDQLALLAALTQRNGPLTDASRDYIVGLMRHVESDQRWGVATIATDPDDTALKNGWLPNSLDGGRWLVNSLGIVRRSGHRYLMAVLTQHGSSFAGGIALDEKIARAALPAVR